MAASPAFAALSGHIERAGGSTEALKHITWHIGAHAIRSSASVGSSLGKGIEPEEAQY